jgi:hypothetical protein
LAVLFFESLAWGYLEQLDIPHMPVGIIVTLFVLLVLFWIFVAIRNDRRRDRES